VAALGEARSRYAALTGLTLLLACFVRVQLRFADDLRAADLGAWERA
jgi:hypothetical protein